MEKKVLKDKAISGKKEVSKNKKTKISVKSVEKTKKSKESIKTTKNSIDKKTDKKPAKTKKKISKTSVKNEAIKTSVETINAKNTKDTIKKASKKTGKTTEPISKKSKGSKDKIANAKPAKPKKVDKKPVKAEKKIKKSNPEVKNNKKPKKTSKNEIKLTTPSFEELENFNINVDDYFLEEKRSNKTPILIGIIVVLAISLITCVFLLIKSNASLFDSSSNIEKEVIRALPKEADPIYKETWQQFHNKAFVPDDYVGQVVFESGLINEPVLQGDTNETYIRRNYETYNYEVCGPVFMDYICDVDNDQNLILYGHNRSTSVDPEHVMMFSPLHVLEDEANYSENKLIYMAYEDKMDIYLVASVYPVKIVEKDDGNQYLVKGEPLYYLNNYSPDQFDTYYKTIKQKQFYDTGVELVNTDELLTLQTCYEDKLDKLIVLAKKIGSINYKEGKKID